ncbi:MAG: hypothetical protein NZM10_00585 [Fimbriimonadales bacterium]|nr:hypothetical protein [Fimbriimonadales bacterium]
MQMISTIMRRWALGIVVALSVGLTQGAVWAQESDKLTRRADVQQQLLNSCAFAQWQEALREAGYTVNFEEGVVATVKGEAAVVTQAVLPLYQKKRYIGTLTYAYDDAGRERIFTQEFVLQSNEAILIRTRDGAELGVDTLVTAQGKTSSELAAGDGLVRLSDFAPANVDWGCFQNCYGSRWIIQCGWDCLLCAICGWWSCPWTCPNCAYCSFWVGIECTAICWR